MNTLIRRRQLAVVLLALTMLQCGKAPPQLTPIGDIAFYARRVIQGVAAVQDTAIEAEKAMALSTEDARPIINAAGVAGQAGVDLSAALKAGASAATARQKAVNTIRSAMESIPKQLTPEGRALIEPYLQVVRTLLTVFE